MSKIISSGEGHSVRNIIREFDPFAAQVLAEYCEQLILKKQSRLNISESILLKSIEMECSNEELIIQRELAGVIRSAKRILEDTSEAEWSDEHKELFLLLKKIVFVGLDDESESSDSDVINQVVDGLMRLDYSQEIPVFQVIDEERNIFNYFGFILDSLAQKFKESTVSSKAVNTYLNFDTTKAFIVTNENGTIRFVSRQLERFLEQSASELIDQSIFDFVPSWSGQTVSELASQAADKPQLAVISSETSHAEAFIKMIEVPRGDDAFGDEADEVREFVVSVNFDTKQVDQEEEIYNSLTSIDGVIDAVKSLKRGSISTSDHNYSLQTSLESLYRLKYSQLDKLNKTEEVVTTDFIDPTTIVNSILSELRFHEGFEDITFEVNNKLMQPFSGQFEMIYSILKSLISNAVKYRHQDKDSRIYVRFAENQTATLIEVIDNGIGIHPDDLEKIFQKGYRASNTIEGYGLGLYFIQRSLKRHDGSISVVSELNHGSKFTITLPR